MALAIEQSLKGGRLGCPESASALSLMTPSKTR